MRGLVKGKQKGTASLDRIDSLVGYIKGNVQWVHKDVNVSKMDFDESYFRQLCAAVTAHAGQHNPVFQKKELLSEVLVC
jgi:hypothetical protein